MEWVGVSQVHENWWPQEKPLGWEWALKNGMEANLLEMKYPKSK